MLASDAWKIVQKEAINFEEHRVEHAFKILHDSIEQAANFPKTAGPNKSSRPTDKIGALMRESEHLVLNRISMDLSAVHKNATMRLEDSIAEEDKRQQFSRLAQNKPLNSLEAKNQTTLVGQAVEDILSQPETVPNKRKSIIAEGVVNAPDLFRELVTNLDQPDHFQESLKKRTASTVGIYKVRMPNSLSLARKNSSAHSVTPTPDSAPPAPRKNSLLKPRTDAPPAMAKANSLSSVASGEPADVETLESTIIQPENEVKNETNNNNFDVHNNTNDSNETNLQVVESTQGETEKTGEGNSKGQEVDPTETEDDILDQTLMQIEQMYNLYESGL